jgi:hypothetical protein
MVRNIPAPTHGLYTPTLPAQSPAQDSLGRARPAAGQRGSRYGRPSPPPVSECGDHMGKGTCWDTWKREGGCLGRKGRGKNVLVSLAHLKLRISEIFREAKDKWHADPQHHGTNEIPPPPPKKSCMDGARNSIARTAAQIRTGHWRSAIYFKRIRKRRSDECWFCTRGARMTRSHALLHCSNATLVAACNGHQTVRNTGLYRVVG